jgi:hypothetical protein
MMISGTIAIADVVPMLERRCIARSGGGVRSVRMTGRLGLRDQVLIGLRRIGRRRIGMPLAEMQTDIVVGLGSGMALTNVQPRVAMLVVDGIVLANAKPRVAMVVVVAMVLADMQSRVAVAIAGSIVLTDVQPHVAMAVVVSVALANVQSHVVGGMVFAHLQSRVVVTLVAALILTRMQLCVAMIDRVFAAGSRSIVVSRRKSIRMKIVRGVAVVGCLRHAVADVARACGSNGVGMGGRVQRAGVFCGM